MKTGPAKLSGLVVISAMAPLVAALSPLSAPARRAVRLVLYFEVVVNVANGLLSLFAPALALQAMTSVALREGADADGGAQGVALEVARWFGVMGAVFGGYLLRRVLDTPAALRPLLEALLLGDALYLGSLLPFCLRFGRLPAVLAPFLMTLPMSCARLLLLLGEDWPEAEARAAATKAQLAPPQAPAAPAPAAAAPTGSAGARRRSLTKAAGERPAERLLPQQEGGN